ncbi:hypothetical protein GEMRC1_003739 [Eukaryota sp. GEM-RC1]
MIPILLLFVGLSYCFYSNATLHNQGRMSTFVLTSDTVENGYWIDEPPRVIFPEQISVMSFDGDLATIRYLSHSRQSIAMEIGYADSAGKSSIVVPDMLSPWFHRCKPAGFIIFVNLTHIDARDNKLQLHQFLSLPNLTHLTLSCNFITSLSIRNPYHSLIYLDLSYNLINSPSIAILSLLPCLRHLDLSYNSIETLPPSISNLPLRSLFLEGNSLTDTCFPTLSLFNSLQELNLGYNKIARVTHVLKSVEYLSLSHNYLETSKSVELLDHFDNICLVFLDGNPFLESIKFKRDIIAQIPTTQQKNVAFRPKTINEQSNRLLHSITRVKKKKELLKEQIQSLPDFITNHSLQSADCDSFFITATTELVTPLNDSTISGIVESSKLAVDSVNPDSIDSLVTKTLTKIEEELEEELPEFTCPKPVGMAMRMLKAELHDPILTLDLDSNPDHVENKMTRAHQERSKMGREVKRSQVSKMVADSLDSLAISAVMQHKRKRRTVSKNMLDLTREVQSKNNENIGVGKLKTEWMF